MTKSVSVVNQLFWYDSVRKLNPISFHDHFNTQECQSTHERTIIYRTTHVTKCILADR